MGGQTRGSSVPWTLGGSGESIAFTSARHIQMRKADCHRHENDISAVLAAANDPRFSGTEAFNRMSRRLYPRADPVQRPFHVGSADGQTGEGKAGCGSLYALHAMHGQILRNDEHAQAMEPAHQRAALLHHHAGSVNQGRKGPHNRQRRGNNNNNNRRPCGAWPDAGRRIQGAGATSQLAATDGRTGRTECIGLCIRVASADVRRGN